jgi:hypothetical protein
MRFVYVIWGYWLLVIGHGRKLQTGNSVKRYIKEIHTKWDNICATAKTEVSFDMFIRTK